jgi:Cu(I)/Ag(I) efflux system membrane fusion protein
MKKQTIFYGITLTIGIFLGWVFFHSSTPSGAKDDHASESVKSTIWTCAMHPQIHMDNQGKCPICGMELIMLNQGQTMDPGSIQMTQEAIQLANVLTSVVSKQHPVKELRLYGKVQADERKIQSQVAYFPGRIEKLFVNFTGEVVRKGQILAIIYSPELLTAQQELLETAALKHTQPALYAAAKEKLTQWKIPEKQINEIEASGKIISDFEVFANTTGIVSGRRVSNGDFVSSGSVLFDVADLSNLWIMFDAYESDLPYLSRGQKVSFTLQALPGIEYSASIAFIDPVLDPVTRTVRVRIEINNDGGKFKPEMFVTGIVQANLNEYQDKLIIPRTAVLWTGKRSVVYVKQKSSDQMAFKIREIVLGPWLGGSYVVMSGLREGEEIVTQGAFSVDASAQLEGKPSMMNPENGTGLPGEAVSQLESGGVPAAEPIVELHFKASGNCDMCRERIEGAAKSVPGVVKAEWDKESKVINIQLNPGITNLDAVERAVAKVGHDTEKFRASDEVYKVLPECCLYRKK